MLFACFLLDTIHSTMDMRLSLGTCLQDLQSGEISYPNSNFKMFSPPFFRKDFALKEQLDEVILQMHAGGFREKWKDDMFNPKVLVLEIG